MFVTSLNEYRNIFFIQALMDQKSIGPIHANLLRPYEGAVFFFMK
jgi:hypothetical protein